MCVDSSVGKTAAMRRVAIVGSREIVVIRAAAWMSLSGAETDL